MYSVINIEHLNNAARRWEKDNVNNKENKYSFTNGTFDIFAAMGELMFYIAYKSIGVNIKYVGSYDYDFLIDGVKVDVKTIAVKSMPPKKHYFAKIAETSLHQRTDFYFWNVVSKDLKKGSFIGYISKAQFNKISVPKKKGQILFENKIFRKEFRADCRIVPFSALRPFKDKRLNDVGKIDHSDSQLKMFD